MRKFEFEHKFTRENDKVLLKVSVWETEGKRQEFNIFNFNAKNENMIKNYFSDIASKYPGLVIKTWERILKNYEVFIGREMGTYNVVKHR
jgi:hypothetical protein